MKTIVVYQSGTGFTKQYAEWIAKEVGCESMELKKLSQSMVSQCDCIIYGGWIMGNGIMGLPKIRKMNPAKLVVFAVGSSKDSDELRSIIKQQNQLGETPFFYMQGGFHYEQLGFVQKMMLNMVKKSITKKENKTEQDLFMEQALGTSFDHSDPKFIKPLVDYVK